jgi:hypothetical protein
MNKNKRKSKKIKQLTTVNIIAPVGYIKNQAIKLKTTEGDEILGHTCNIDGLTSEEILHKQTAHLISLLVAAESPKNLGKRKGALRMLELGKYLSDNLYSAKSKYQS